MTQQDNSIPPASQTPQAPLAAPGDTQPQYPAPTTLESLMTLGLIALVGYTCWVLYGPLIVQMFRDIAYVLMRR